MVQTLGAQDLRRLRLRAQLLTQPRESTGSGVDRVVDVARHMTAVQGQDWRSSRWALGVRAPGTTVQDVSDAFNTGRILRSWPMRGTVHVTAAEDIGWIQRLTGRRVLAGAPKRRAYLELDDATLDRMVEVAMAGLSGGASLDRDELAALWTDAGINWKSNWRYHVIWWLCQNGLGVFGPTDGGEPRLVAAAEWITDPIALEGDEALAALATRYAAARGPVFARDFAWWSGLTMTEAKRGIALAVEAGDLVPVHIEAAPGSDQRSAAQSEGVCAPELLDTVEPAPDWLLLAPFDEYLLGYTDRSAQLAPEHFELVVPGRNGMFLGTIASEGQNVGTWKRSARRPGKIEIAPFPGERIDPDALRSVAERWGSFHGIDPVALEIAERS